MEISRILPPIRGGGSLPMIRDKCIRGDHSSSYYDGSCEAEDAEHGSAEDPIEKDSEYLTAYQWAYKYGITTMNTYEKARITDSLTREEMAKMISVYAMAFLDKKPDLNKSACSQFDDLSLTTSEMQKYMVTACQLGLMGLGGDGITVQPRFYPYPLLSRAEAGTILSRMLRATQYATRSGDLTYYARHLDALKKAEIMKLISDPSMQELRGNMFIMLKRMQLKGL